jgi:hypothetical protein
LLQGHSGKTYRALPTSETEIGESSGVEFGVSCTKWGDSGPDVFDGCARRAAKTTMLTLDEASPESFTDVSALRATLKEDSAMIHHNPPIAHDAESERVDEELKNVAVDAYLFAVAKESDRDFHIIVGDQGCNDQACFMNAEVSALPKSTDDLDAFLSVRQSLIDMFGEEPVTTYWQIDPPAPVHIEGTLFYDIDHRPGGVGPSWAKPDTSWEIHPIRQLVLRDD